MRHQKHLIAIRTRHALCAIACLSLGGLAWGQTPSLTPKVDNRAPGTAASDVAPGAREWGLSKDSRRSYGGGPALNQGASSAQTYDYPASAPKTAPPKRP
ncbi:hypothetical protein [Cupriavidus pauculus]|uniref:Uncharacterized protein n=1 Tax=Cupriavidus pauculus TaxID=82633 RepID=A0A2N5C4P9_9BURK|nr:hypothetical protein [Cupriavidus pauculus]PLP97187.1 hypothetical protein CYJ10_28100 [Cupriavidus pauculus]